MPFYYTLCYKCDSSDSSSASRYGSTLEQWWIDEYTEIRTVHYLAFHTFLLVFIHVYF